jgi:hypothetical protein
MFQVLLLLGRRLALKTIVQKCVFVPLIAMMVAPLVTAQNTADILGRASDSSGGVLPNVKITATNTATNVQYTGVTDASGNYVVRLLPPGTYDLRAEVTGFKGWTASTVTLAGGDRLRQDIALQIGDVSQSVEVSSEAPALQTETATVGSLITTTAVDNLPLNGRNFINLVQLTAGAIDPVGPRPLALPPATIPTIAAGPPPFRSTRSQVPPTTTWWMAWTTMSASLDPSSSSRRLKPWRK